MKTYEELESQIDAQQNSILFSLKQLLFGADGIDVDDVQARRSDVEAEFQSFCDQAQATVTRVENQTETARQNGEQLPETFDIEPEEIENYSEQLVAFQSENARYLRADEHETLSALSNSLADWAAYVRAKQEFDAEYERVVPLVDSLVRDAEPHLEYDAYLTAPVERRITESIPVVRDELDTLRSRANLRRLADADRDQIAQLETQLNTIIETLDGYNEEFVKRQRTEYSSLFTDIDDAGHDLNVAQQQAIVRNGYYNQVVAGAGTGKTFALIYRVAYLVREGIEPDDIVALTYTKEAATEMETRLDSEFGITNVDVRTIHSFAYQIAQETRSSNRSVAQARDKYNLIEDVLDKAEDSTSEFGEHYLQFLYNYNYNFFDKVNFHKKTDYIAARREQTYETLAGETVASEAEKVIADFLFTHNVKYQYESIAEWAETAEDKGPYRPDFYLPAYDIYIEHWGIDENGEVAPWFSWSTEEYLQKLHWAQKEFKRNDVSLIDTYDFEHETGRLKRALQHRLTVAGVDLDRMEFDEFVDDVFEYNNKKEAIKDSFKDFIENAKTFDVSPEEISGRLDRSKPRQYHFGLCGKHMLEEYNQYLERNDLMDFDDMIYDAIAAIQEDIESFQSRYEHVLVDEFQDVAMSQIRLIRPFVGPDADTRLFCVGDDWQSIYSFQGSEIDYFINFAEHFGPPEPVQTRLTANYRCPETVIQASNDLIRNNDEQIEKRVKAHSGRDTQPVLHTLDGYQDRQYEQRVGTYAAQLIERFLDSGSDLGEIMVLCRYDKGAPYIENLKQELRHRDIPYDGKNDTYRPADMPGEHSDDFDEEAGVSAFSVHQAKGREAKHVILLHAVTGPMGFPPESREDDLIAPVQDVATNTTAEERRLFYVALTRATEDLHVMTRADEESPFVTEIRQYFEEETSLIAPGEEGDRVSVTARVEKLWDDTHEAQQQAGVLEDKTGTTKFVSWSDDDPLEVVTDTWYKFDGLRVNEFQGETQLVIDDSSTAIALFDEQPEQASPEYHSGAAQQRTQSTTGGPTASGTTANNSHKGNNESGIPPAIVGGPKTEVSYQQLQKENEPIGSGGDAVVYCAELDYSGQQQYLALKQPDQRGTLPAETVRRFLNEAETWKKLDNHDHIVDVVDWGSQPLPWIAMEYMNGGDLQSRAGELPFDQAVWTAVSISKAIRHAHNRGVRHYDLKPENVLFRSVTGTYWDIPKVADWGLAEQALQSGSVETGMTPAYAAPEQLFDEYGVPDHQTDIYQLGLLYYELFTGVHPYDGDMTQIHSNTVTPPSEIRSDIPAELDSVLLPAIQTEPAERYEDILDLRRALNDLRSGHE